jgi:glucan phosphoethanolaminetransferase (alkaline phosphatase superfamily)
MERVGSTLKGIIIGLLVCVVLETSMIFVFAALTGNGAMRLEGIIGVLTYFIPLIAIFFISGWIGLTIARKSKDFKSLSSVLSVVMALILGSNYFYFWWWWNNNLQQYLTFDNDM